MELDGPALANILIILDLDVAFMEAALSGSACDRRARQAFVGIRGRRDKVCWWDR